jgi:CBS domain-containing protein
MNRVDRFLDAFARIERNLRHLTKSNRHTPFSTLVKKAASSDRLIRRREADLLELGDLRNAIVHERRGGEPIADPHQATVIEIEALADLIEDPPRVTLLKRPKVVSCSPTTPVGEAARLMLASDFSQLPVYDRDSWCGLLTSETIARWLATRLEGGVGILEEETVELVLPLREPSSTESFLERDARLMDVVESFEQAARTGRRLDAVLITHSAQRDQSPLMILTVFDLPEIYRRLDLSSAGETT